MEVKHNRSSEENGLAVIDTIFDIYGKDVSRSQIKETINDDLSNIDLPEMQSYLEDQGFVTEIKRWSGFDQNSNDKVKESFVLPLKGASNQEFLVIQKKKKDIYKVYVPKNGSDFYAKESELMQIANIGCVSDDPLDKEVFVEAIILRELKLYGIHRLDFLKQYDSQEIISKLSYFNHTKKKFPFKNEIVEKEFLLDLLDNKEQIWISKRIHEDYYKTQKLALQLPNILIVKLPKDNYSVNPNQHQDKGTSYLYWHLFKQLNGQKKLWFIYIFAAFFSAFVTQLAVFINQLLIDHILPSYNMQMLILFAIGLGIYQLFNIFTTAYKRFVGVHLKNQLDRFFLQRFDEKINQFSLQFIRSYKKGDLIERVSDSMKLKRFFTKFFTNVLIDLSISVYSIMILFLINWKLTLLVLLVLVLFFFWFRFITPLLRRNEQIRFQEKASFLSKVIEKIEGIQFIKSFGIEKKETAKVYKSIDSYLKIQLKNEYLNLFNTTVTSLIVGVMRIVVILSLSHYVVATHNISLGQVITFIALSSKIFSAFKGVLNQNLTLQRNQIILKRFFEFQEDLPKEEQAIKGIKDFSIEEFLVKKISFSYPSQPKILKEISFAIKGTEKIQVVGGNGSGKSTLGKVIASLYTPDSGNILVNAVDAKFYDKTKLHSKVLLSTGDDMLLNDTVLENICLGRAIDPFEIIRVSKRIGFYDFITSKVDGFHFKITNNGKNISKGQRKKILLLRAFFSSAELIILDEVLSGIDKESRDHIEHYIDQDPRKYIIVSHEPVVHIAFSNTYNLTHGILTSL